MRSDHGHFLRQAIQLAVDNAASGQGGPYGAVIVKDGVIIARGVNQVTAHNDPTAHAEIVAIREACAKLHDFQLTDCILYSSCEPCPMCLGAIYWSRLAQVYYASTRYDAARAGFDDSFIYDEIALAPNARRIAMVYMNMPEADSAFEAWVRKANKVEY